MSEHNTILDPDIHEPKGVAAALLGQVYTANGSGSGAWQAQAALPSTVIAVESLTDFPTPVAGVITLAPSCLYQINKIVNIAANRIVFSEGSILQGLHRTISGLTSTTTGVLLSGTSVDMRFETLTLDAPTATLLYSFNGGGTKIFSARDMLSVTHTGVVAEVTAALNTIFEFSLYSGGTDAIRFIGTHTGGWLIDTCGIVGYTGDGIDWGTSVVPAGRLAQSLVAGTGGGDVSLKGLASSGNVSAGQKWFIEGVDFTGATTILSGLADDDIQILYRDNNGIKDTQREAQGFIVGNALTTTISTINTPVIVNIGTGFIDAHAEQFTVSTAGRMTYNGLDNIDVAVFATVTGTGTSGTNTYAFYIAKNGTVITAASASREFVSTTNETLTVIGIAMLQSGDFIEVFVENQDGTTNYDLIDLNVVAR